jgi:sugar phosphate isomerase/epimerase
MHSPRVRIGNQTSSRVQPALRPYEFALRHGFDAFEWFSDKGRTGWAEPDMDSAARRRLREAVEERDVVFSVHAPHYATPFNPDGVRLIRRSLDFAHDVGAAVINIHLFTDQGVPAFAAALEPLIEDARAANVRLSIENTPHTGPDDFNALFALLATVPGAQGAVVGMCLDNGHANLCAATRNEYLGFVDRLTANVPIVHWHAHENWGDRDSHLALFTGPSAHNDAGVRGLVQRLLRRGFRGNVVLEQYPDPPELLVQARARLKKLFGPAAE